MKTQKFCIEGMSCIACSSGIERALKRKKYIKNIEVYLLSKTASVCYDETQASLDDIFAFIVKMGYTPHLIFDESKNLQDNCSLECHKDSRIFSALNLLEIFARLEKRFLTPNKRLVLSIFFTILILYLSMFAMFFPLLMPFSLHDTKFNGIAQLICTLVVMHMGRSFYFRGFGSLIKGSPNMDTLIAIGTASAFIYSLYQLIRIFIGLESLGLYFESVCVIITFVLLGKTIEERSKVFATDVLKKLITHKSKSSIKIQGWFEKGRENKREEIEIKIEEIMPNDVLKILPGAYIPVDGIILEGMANLDESALTGEVLPLFKNVGEKVYSGTINTDRTFFMQALKPARFSALATIVSLIKSAQESKAPIARIADKISAFFVPSVIAIAVLAGIFWWIQKDFVFGLEIFICVLVISCPCALGLATPMSIMVGSGRCASGGIFFKNAQSLENTQKVTTIVFDKTGTLSTGKLSVQEVISFGMSSDELLSIASAIEGGSEHIVAQAIIAYAKEQGITPKIAKDFQIKAGYGICAKIDNETFKIGNQEIFTSTVFPKIPKSVLKEGLIVVWIAKTKKIEKKDEILGAILLKDTLKKNTQKTIASLKNMGIKIALLSGDSARNVQIVADELGIVQVVAQAKPKDKLEFIQSLQDEGEIVMMVGDGINDAPALALANVAMVMRKGSDASLESSDVIIFSDDTQGVPNAISLSKATIKNIKENLFWAFCYNVIFIPLACGVAYKAGILLNPMFASLAMSLSSVSVVLNAQRLRKFRFEV